MSFKLAFSTLGCPDWTIEEVGRHAGQYGYDGIELRLLDGEIVPDELDADGRRRIKAALGNVALCAVGTSCRFTFQDAEERARNRRSAEKYLAMANDLGSPMIRVFGGHPNDGQTPERRIELIAESLNELAPAAERAGVRIVLETHDVMAVGRSVADVLSRVPSRAVGALWDVHHPFRNGETLEQTWDLLKDRLYHTHVKDGRLEGDREQLVLLGEGRVPVKEFLGVLHQNGWDGWVSVEWEKKWHPEIPGPEVAMPHHAKTLRSYLRDIAAGSGHGG